VSLIHTQSPFESEKTDAKVSLPSKISTLIFGIVLPAITTSPFLSNLTISNVRSILSLLDEN